MTGLTTNRLDEIVLGSASPRRLELLRSLGLRVHVHPSSYGEPDDPLASPPDLAARHAREKALDVRSQLARGGGPSMPIVTADTVVDVDGIALNKPADPADAVRMLRILSAREHLVHTAFAIALPGDGPLLEERSTTRVRFFSLTADEIAAYVETGEPMDKAGAYGIQGRAASLVESIEGDFYTVMGFPLGRFVRLLQRSGFTLPTAKQSPVG